MKIITPMLAVILISSSFFCACKKNNSGGGQNNNSYSPDSIRNLVSQSLIDSLKKWGMQIYDGKTPPDVAGIYHLDPDSCIFDNAPNDSADNQKGLTISPYKYRFSKQDNSTQAILVDRKDDSGIDVASNSEGYIAGSGNNFTIFALEKVAAAVSHTEIRIISGQVTSSGISNFQTAFYLLSKENNYHYIPIGTIRIYVDKDGMAERITEY